jgi:hypothetical protein
MPVSVPTQEEFDDLEHRAAATLQDMQAQLDGLSGRVTSLENAEPLPPDPEPGPEPPATGTLRAVVTIGGTSYTFDEDFGAVDMGDYVDPDGRFIMSCKRATHPDLLNFRVDFRRIDGWQCVIFEHGDPLSTTPANLGAYTATITDDAGTLHTVELPAHWWNARWRWQSGPWPLPMANVDDLVARNLLPKLDAAMNYGTAGHLAIPSYTPMSTAGLTAEMPATGGRADIGIVTDWQAEYLCTRSSEMLAGVLAQGEAGGTMPWWYRDVSTGALLDIMNSYRQASLYWNGQANPYIHATPPGSGITLDSAHQPALAALPFLLTGDPYFLEVLQCQCLFAFLEAPRSSDNVWAMPGSGQTRCMAWNLRTIALAAKVTPAETPRWLLPQRVMQQMLDDQCVKGLTTIINEPRNLRDPLSCIDVGLPGYDSAGPAGWYPASTSQHPWQSSFFAQAVAWGATLHPQLAPIAAFVAKHLIARTNNVDWPLAHCVPYFLQLRPNANGETWFASWAACWTANKAILGETGFPTELAACGDYEGGVYAGLCALAAARAAGLSQIPATIDDVLANYAAQMDKLLVTGNNYLTWNNSYAR